MKYCPVCYILAMNTEENQLTFLNPTQCAQYKGAITRIIMLALPISELMAQDQTTQQGKSSW